MFAATARLLFSTPEQDVPAEIDLVRETRERCGGDDRRLDLRLVPLAVRRIAMEEHVGDHETQHRVAQKFERLVVDDAA